MNDFLNSLEKAAEKYADKEAKRRVYPNEWSNYFVQDSFTGEDIYYAFKAGAKWMRDEVASTMHIMDEEDFKMEHPMTEDEAFNIF
jgi:hypothetical protein